MFLRFLRPAIAIVVLCSVVPACRTAATETCTGSELRLRQAKTLTVASDYAYPPFAFRSKKGDLVGFDVDILKAVAKELKVEVRFVNRGMGALVPGVLAHSHDLAASGLRETERLRDEACVSAGYLDADLAVLVGAPGTAGIGGASDLGGRKVGVLDGSRAERWANENLGDSTIAPLPTTDDLLTAIRQKLLDAVVDDLAIARFAAKESSAFSVAGRIETDERFVFVAAPDNVELIARLNDGLAKIAANGKKAKIERKWFGG